MRLWSGRRPGTVTAFVDSASGDVLLALRANEVGQTSVQFRLRDKSGVLVEETDGFEYFNDGLVVSGQGEVLLELPRNPEEAIQYRLYNSLGKLLTQSDGKRTQIYGHLRMESTAAAPGTPRFHDAASRLVPAEEHQPLQPPAN